LRVEAGIPARAAIRTLGNASCDPYRAALGVMGAAARAGAAIFERSPARRIVPARHEVRVSTPAGAVTARQVVIATGYATREFRPLAGRFALTYTYVLATAPLTDRDRRDVGLADVLLWDTRRPYHYARWTPDHRLILGGGDTPTAGGRAAPARIAAATLEIRGHVERLLPATAGLRVAHAWEGRFAETPDALPYIGPHRRYPRHAFALGYGGNGMTFAALAARILVEQWHGERSVDHALFGFGRTR
jgi:glycine/D-amino acid oxidase-like deaminating enzyme